MSRCTMPARVRGVQRIGNFDGDGEERLGLHRLAGDLMAQGYAIEILHRDEGTARRLPRFREWCRCWDG